VFTLLSLAHTLGGIVAQELIKQVGKYTPMDQTLHIDFFEAVGTLPASDSKPLGTRYDHQISLFGKVSLPFLFPSSFMLFSFSAPQAAQEKLEQQKFFVVGCGALGCELLKGIAMSGLGRSGQINTTDMVLPFRFATFSSLSDSWFPSCLSLCRTASNSRICLVNFCSVANTSVSSSRSVPPTPSPP
jgi:hypothetical protein